MGMFDSFYDAAGQEFQTKAFACLLDVYRVGDEVRADQADFQVEIYTGRYGRRNEWLDTYATVRGGKVESIHTPRDERLPLLDSYGGWSDSGTGA